MTSSASLANLFPHSLPYSLLDFLSGAHNTSPLKKRYETSCVVTVIFNIEVSLISISVLNGFEDVVLFRGSRSPRNKGRPVWRAGSAEVERVSSSDGRDHRLGPVTGTAASR